MRKHKKKIIFIVLAFFGLFLYQELGNLNSYSYTSLWNVKTRTKVFKKENSEVHLIGMIHIGRDSYYKTLINEYKDNKDSIITLSEGVQERKKEGRLSSFSYDKLAKVSGLVSQKDTYKEYPNMKNSDIYFEDFDPRVQSYMKDMNNALRLVVGFLNGEVTLTETREILNKTPIIEPELFNQELLIKRNDILWASIIENLDSHKTVVVPWGASHHEDMEKRLIDLGYKETARKTYTALNLLPVIGYLSFYTIKGVVR